MNAVISLSSKCWRNCRFKLTVTQSQCRCSFSKLEDVSDMYQTTVGGALDPAWPAVCGRLHCSTRLAANPSVQQPHSGASGEQPNPVRNVNWKGLERLKMYFLIKGLLIDFSNFFLITQLDAWGVWITTFISLDTDCLSTFSHFGLKVGLHKCCSLIPSVGS